MVTVTTTFEKKKKNPQRLSLELQEVSTMNITCQLITVNLAGTMIHSEWAKSYITPPPDMNHSDQAVIVPIQGRL
jgi:hypothetical protein